MNVIYATTMFNGTRNFTDKSGGKCCNECFNKIVFPKMIERLIKAVEKVQVEEIDPKSVPAGRAREYFKHKRRELNEK